MSNLVALNNRATTQTSNRLMDALRQLGVSIGDLGSMVDDYATAQPTGSLTKIALGADPNTQMGLKRGLAKLGGSIPGVSKEAATRFALTNPVAKNALRVVPGLSFLGAGAAAADILTGEEGFGNKAMDTVAMGIGGFLGAAGGPVGIAAGAGMGKAASDATQWLFGDKKSAEQRKMEEALALLRGGQI